MKKAVSVSLLAKALAILFMEGWKRFYMLTMKLIS